MICTQWRCNWAVLFLKSEEYMAMAYDSSFTRVDVFESPADATAVWRCTVWWMKTATVPRVPIDANKSRGCENPSLGGPQTSVDKRMLLHVEGI